MEKVLIVGRTLEVGRTEEVYNRGFSEIGCKVQHFTWEEAVPSLVSRTWTDRIAWRLAWQHLAKPANHLLLETAHQFQPELTLVMSPLFLHPSSIRALKCYGPVFVFFTDNPLDQHHTHSNLWVRQGFPLWDVALIWSQDLVKQLTEQGVQKAFFHPFCSDIQYHFPKRQPQPTYDVAFIGNWDTSRKREQYLQAIADYRLGLWGSTYWNTHCREPRLKGLCQGMCDYQQIPEVLGSTRIGLNILRPQNQEGHNIRTYEIPATGTLMLSERSQELLNLFTEDKEAIYFSSPAELRQKTEYLLRTPDLGEAIAKAGYEKALKNTIADRIIEITNLYQACTIDS